MKRPVLQVLGAFLLEAALSAATYSRWLMMDTASFTDDPTVRGAVLFSTYVVGYSFLGAASLATAVWLVGVVVLGRRRAYLGLAMSIILIALAGLLVVGTVTGFAIPTTILHVVVWGALGVRLLRISALPGGLGRQAAGFRPIRHAWRVEVAHGRLGRSRRLASFENTATSATGWLQVACITTTLRHLPRERARRHPVALAA